MAATKASNSSESASIVTTLLLAGTGYGCYVLSEMTEGPIANAEIRGGLKIPAFIGMVWGGFRAISILSEGVSDLYNKTANFMKRPTKLTPLDAALYATAGVAVGVAIASSFSLSVASCSFIGAVAGVETGLIAEYSIVNPKPSAAASRVARVKSRALDSNSSAAPPAVPSRQQPAFVHPRQQFISYPPSYAPPPSSSFAPIPYAATDWRASVAVDSKESVGIGEDDRIEEITLHTFISNLDEELRQAHNKAVNQDTKIQAIKKVLEKNELHGNCNEELQKLNPTQIKETLGLNSKIEFDRHLLMALNQLKQKFAS